MGSRSNNNPFNHNRYTDDEARSALGLVAFSAFWGGTAQIVPSEVAVLVSWSPSAFAGTCFSSSQGRFVAPIPGKYQLNAYVQFINQAPGVMEVLLKRNGVWHQIVRKDLFNIGVHNVSMSILTNANTNDYYDLWFWHATGQDVTIESSAAYNYFNGHLVGV